MGTETLEHRFCHLSMIRTTLLLLLVTFLCCYAWRNWFVSLCWSILLVAVVQHPDFPKSLGGIQGANPWNVLFLVIFIAAWKDRVMSRRSWDIPSIVKLMLFGYLLVVVFGVLRLLTNLPEGEPDFTFGAILSEDIINCIKWVIPGLLLFDAVRTRERVAIAIATILTLYFLLALQVVKCVPLSAALSGGGELNSRAYKATQNNIGYNRVTLSMMLAGASWAVLVVVPLVKNKFHKVSLVGVAGVITLGQALTGGRTGYVTWAAVGLILAVTRWRKLLPIVPVAAVVILVSLPAVRERMFQGFAKTEGNIEVQQDSYEMTSGRNLAWPMVIDKIFESPLTGYGKEAMTTTGLKDILLEDLNESFPHPHQAYLEVLLDNGLIGFLIIIPFYLYCLRQSFVLLTDRSDPLYSAVGGMAVSLILALMIGAVGGQTFYPREGSVGMWATIGLMLRLSVERNRKLAAQRYARYNPSPRPAMQSAVRM